jgi:hypothetical protein
LREVCLKSQLQDRSWPMLGSGSTPLPTTPWPSRESRTDPDSVPEEPKEPVVSLDSDRLDRNPFGGGSQRRQLAQGLLPPRSRPGGIIHESGYPLRSGDPYMLCYACAWSAKPSSSRAAGIGTHPTTALAQNRPGTPIPIGNVTQTLPSSEDNPPRPTTTGRSYLSQVDTHLHEFMTDPISLP